MRPENPSCWCVAAAALWLFSLSAALMAEAPRYTEIDWSLGSSVGPVWGATDPSDQQHAVDTGDTLRVGGRIFGNLRYRQVGVEAGYVNLGSPDAGIEVPVSAELADFADAIPKSGHGLDLTLVGYWDITQRIELHGRAGLWYWQGELQAGNESESIGGFDGVLGAGASYQVDQHWALRADLNRYQMEDQPGYFLGLGVTYDFGRPIRIRRSTAESEPEPEPTPLLPDPEPEPEPIPEMVVLDPEPEPAVPEVDRWNIYFETRSAGVEDIFNDMLDQVAAESARVPEWTILIEGHTDSRGTAEMNQHLSESRARAVKWALFKRGVPVERMTTRGHGPEQLAADESDTSGLGGMARNRRVEILLVPDEN